MKIFRRLYSEPQNGNQKSRGSRGGKNRGGKSNNGGGFKNNQQPKPENPYAKLTPEEAYKASKENTARELMVLDGRGDAVAEHSKNIKKMKAAEEKAKKEAAEKIRQEHLQKIAKLKSRKKLYKNLKIGGAVVLGTGLVAGGAYAGKKLYDKHQEKKANEAMRRKIFPGDKKQEQEEND